MNLLYLLLNKEKISQGGLNEIRNLEHRELARQNIGCSKEDRYNRHRGRGNELKGRKEGRVEGWGNGRERGRKVGKEQREKGRKVGKK